MMMKVVGPAHVSWIRKVRFQLGGNISALLPDSGFLELNDDLAWDVFLFLKCTSR